MTYAVEITKDADTRFFGLNTEDRADRFAAKMVKEGFSVTRSTRDTADVLRSMFPSKFAGG